MWAKVVNRSHPQRYFTDRERMRRGETKRQRDRQRERMEDESQTESARDNQLPFTTTDHLGRRRFSVLNGDTESCLTVLKRRERDNNERQRQKTMELADSTMRSGRWRCGTDDHFEEERELFAV
jgi:hypothetical protein